VFFERTGFLIEKSEKKFIFYLEGIYAPILLCCVLLYLGRPYCSRGEQKLINLIVFTLSLLSTDNWLFSNIHLLEMCLFVVYKVAAANIRVIFVTENVTYISFNVLHIYLLINKQEIQKTIIIMKIKNYLFPLKMVI